jgi:hypothetical protein
MDAWTAAAAAAGAAASIAVKTGDSSPQFAQHDSTATVDVLVLGAGIAGLAAAAALKAHGLSVLLLEGRDRIGEESQHRSLIATDVEQRLRGQFTGCCPASSSGARIRGHVGAHASEESLRALQDMCRSPFSCQCNAAEAIATLTFNTAL